MAYHQRGLDSRNEQNQQNIIRDTRTLSVRISDGLKKGSVTAVVLATTAGVNFFLLPHFSELLLIAGIIVFLYCVMQKQGLPFRKPLYAHEKDDNDVNPATGKANIGEGIYFFGNEKKTKEELWFTNSDMRTHVLIFGSTGSGKTEALVSLAYNALLQASGFIYVDGKGDNSLFAKVFSMVRSMGREDDLLLINFMTGARDIIGPQEKRLSNTLNPFARGSSSMLSQLVISLMDSSSASPDGDMWKGRAIGFVEALMKVLVAMRDAGHILLDANVIRNYFLLPKLEAMVVDKVFIRDNEESINLEGLPPAIMEPISNYVYNLPGYNKEKKGKQVSQVLEQHGFITMQLTRAFTSLADTYGHIMRTQLAEVDLTDVVLNRRILCVLLPALEKAPEELSNLGKVIIATLKAMMAAGLGDAVEGSYADLIERKPTNAATPYLCILDEYGYYAVKGFAVVPAQARSLGFSVIFAGQDLPAFQKASKEEAASIGANTNIKICMKLEDPTETWDFFMKGAGEAYVTHVDSFQVDQGSVLGTYADARGARMEKRSRIDLQDLKEQQPGEAHFFFKSKIVRASFFYASPKPVAKMRLNHFLKIAAIKDSQVKELLESFTSFEALSQVEGQLLTPELKQESEIAEMLSHWQANEERLPIERAVAVMQQFNRQVELPKFFEDVEPELPSDHLNIFTGMRVSDYIKEVVKTPDFESFKKPILNRSFTRDQIEYVQRLLGKSGQQSMNVAIEVINDMEKGTHYPPDFKPEISEAELTSKIYDIMDKIALRKAEGLSED